MFQRYRKPYPVQLAIRAVALGKFVRIVFENGEEIEQLSK